MTLELLGVYNSDTEPRRVLVESGLGYRLEKLLPRDKYVEADQKSH